ncbi:peroxidase 50-like [Dendrobium catenatum]|uniref:Peroxidase 50 n=1 Tax=Dendrobium catenatum TaxID=906689 RepID=A0A2I0VCY4_9ASPA|nr:peroxidase 50-like [Dendrobium catenatum]PKU61266.1 Peroxidase 50 [Dendrobium catenatum]
MAELNLELLFLVSSPFSEHSASSSMAASSMYFTVLLQSYFLAFSLFALFLSCDMLGCDASVISASTANNKVERDNSNNPSLAGDDFDTVIKASVAVDAITQCRDNISCANILVIATPHP